MAPGTTEKLKCLGSSQHRSGIWQTLSQHQDPGADGEEIQLPSHQLHRAHHGHLHRAEASGLRDPQGAFGAKAEPH